MMLFILSCQLLIPEGINPGFGSGGPKPEHEVVDNLTIIQSDSILV